ncbi:MAG TPA: S41 family peptidase [Terriglobia bacterium]|nr:S41 family peptidase [Terriglobia bacterium]
MAALLILIVGLVAGMALDRVVALGLPFSDARPNFKLMSQAWTLIHRYYVDRAAERPPVLTYGAISGMVNALGDTGHSRFLDPSMVRQLTVVQRNQYQGVGAEVQSKGGRVVIVAPLDGSPAQRAGLKPGDIILQVNGRNIAGRPLEQVIAEILGPAGTPVTLTILTPASGETRQMTLIRAKVHLDNVTWQMLPGTRIVHLRIAAFNAGAAADLRKALSDINRESPAGVILDLRNNPGGLLSEAAESSSQFLQTGSVLRVRNPRGQEKSVPVEPGGEATGIPLVALVNGGTASGAEIMAGALCRIRAGRSWWARLPLAPEPCSMSSSFRTAPR